MHARTSCIWFRTALSDILSSTARNANGPIVIIIQYALCTTVIVIIFIASLHHIQLILEYECPTNVNLFSKWIRVKEIIRSPINNFT